MLPMYDVAFIFIQLKNNVNQSLMCKNKSNGMNVSVRRLKCRNSNFVYGIVTDIPPAFR